MPIRSFVCPQDLITALARLLVKPYLSRVQLVGSRKALLHERASLCGPIAGIQKLSPSTCLIGVGVKECAKSWDRGIFLDHCYNGLNSWICSCSPSTMKTLVTGCLFVAKKGRSNASNGYLLLHLHLAYWIPLIENDFEVFRYLPRRFISSTKQERRRTKNLSPHVSLLAANFLDLCSSCLWAYGF